jgi:hypothetical protein
MKSNKKWKKDYVDKIIELFCVVDDRPYPNGSVYGKDTELYSSSVDETAREKAREDVKELIKNG